MPDPGKIQGGKLVTLFEELIATRTIISMQVAGKDFQRLTCITAIERGADGNHLLVDRPDGFDQAVSDDEPVQLRFNFNGADHLEHLFETHGLVANGADLKIPFPDHVERLQRRRNFRIDTLPGTKLLFTCGKIQGQIDLINVSLGGAYGLLTKHNQKGLKGSLFKMDQRLYKIGILFPADKSREEDLVLIKKAEVRRIEHDRERKQYKYAFEFTTMDGNNTQRLTEAIYHIQRQFLQNR